MARQLDRPHTLAMALNLVSWTHVYRGEAKIAMELAEAAIILSTRQEFPHWRAMGILKRGKARALLGEPESLADVGEGWRAYVATGALLGAVDATADHALRLGLQGRIAEALPMLDEALAVTMKGGERHCLAEVHRFRGELLLRGGVDDGVAEAEQCFRTAIGVAREQRAKSLELRATTSLARLLEKQGHRAEARAMLAEIYNWFTEGFDTADLRDAKALLDKLST